MGFFDLGAVSPNEFSTAAMLAEASYKGNKPSDGWKALSGTELGFEKGVLGGEFSGSFDKTTFNNGPASAVIFQKGSELAISFRGSDFPKEINGITDGASKVSAFLDDLTTGVALLGNPVVNYTNYHYGSLLNAVKDYAESHNIPSANVLVTGHSLGAGAANLLLDTSADKYDGFFSNADYITFAAPVIADRQDIFNLGFANDLVFKMTPKLFIDSYADFTSTTDNLLWYDDPQMASQNVPMKGISAHPIGNYIQAVERIRGSEFYSDMNRDSNVVLVALNAEAGSPTGIQVVNNEPTYWLGLDGKADTIKGAAGNDTIEGFGGADILYGNAGDDLLRGGIGNDHLVGGPGNDRLNGGADKDSLWGDAGADEFIFNYASHADGDVIKDFSVGSDRVNLSEMDADSGLAGNQDFTWIVATAFTGTVAGQLCYEHKGGDTYLSGDTNGDKKADFTIQVLGNVSFTSADIIGLDFTPTPTPTPLSLIASVPTAFQGSVVDIGRDGTPDRFHPLTGTLTVANDDSGNPFDLRPESGPDNGPYYPSSTHGIAEYGTAIAGHVGKAVLVLPLNGFGYDPPDNGLYQVDAFVYAGNGLLELNDYSQGSFAARFTFEAGDWPRPIMVELDVNVVNSVLDAGDWLGVNLVYSGPISDRYTGGNYYAHAVYFGGEDGVYFGVWDGPPHLELFA